MDADTGAPAAPAASGLCAANEPDLKACRATLDAWAARVRSETERHRYRFERNPAEFENSKGFFRMLMLCVVLTEDYTGPGSGLDGTLPTGATIDKSAQDASGDTSADSLAGQTPPSPVFPAGSEDPKCVN